MQTNQRQGGWVASFIVIAGLLGFALLGGAYYVKTHQSQAVGEPAPTEITKTDSNDQADNQKKADDQTTKSAEEADKSKTDEPTEAQSDDDGAAMTDEQPSETAVLPQTGPAENALAALAVGSLTFAGVTFVRSRR